MKKNNRKQNKLLKSIPYIILVLSDILICLIYYILKVLKEVNFYELIYYFTSDQTGSSWDIIIEGIKTCLLAFVLVLVILLIPITHYKKKDISIKIKSNTLKVYPTYFNKHKLLYSIIILLLSIVILLKVVRIDEYIEASAKLSKIYETHYVNTNNVKITFPNEKRNLILIYLESMESSLVSQKNGGAFEESRIPELENIALENLNFSNTEKLGGGYNLTLTSWTIAGTVASTSGTPLLAQIKNKYSKVDNFMPNVRTLGDILKSEGYNLEVIQGSNIKFGGTKKYYKQHGDYKLFDIRTAKKKEYIPKNYFVWWGYEDSKLFEYSKKEILEISKENKPFAVTMYTMDTHFKDGYLNETCDTPFDDQMSNVYACSSKMVNDFLNWIKKQDFYENTTIVLIGDHLTMQSGYYAKHKDYTRTIYNAFVNTPVKTNFNKNREFSSLDMYPTILASLGAKVDGEQLGFGINLFSGKETLIESMGKTKFNYELLKKSDYYMNEILNDNVLNKL